ncbi:MAG: TIGR03619 family F420-dependent LLM class oxidoreductase [Acidimicrobiales bacterium]
MKFGFVLPNNWGLDDPSPIIDLAVDAEEAGLDSVWVNHHVINVGYIADRLGDRPYYDALTVLDWVGARTERVRLGTSVLVMPYLHPMVLAKSLATLDRLSNGRVVAGLGVGSLPEENAVLDVDYAERGARSDEFISVMRALWAEGPASHEGRFHRFDGVVTSPKPAQRELPIWIGGSGAPARARAARVGQGWHPMCSVSGLARRMPRLESALADNGRSRTDIVVAPRIDISQVPDRASVEAWSEAGADQLIVGVGTADIDGLRAALADVAALADR